MSSVIDNRRTAAPDCARRSEPERESEAPPLQAGRRKEPDARGRRAADERRLLGRRAPSAAARRCQLRAGRDNDQARQEQTCDTVLDRVEEQEREHEREHEQERQPQQWVPKPRFK